MKGTGSTEKPCLQHALGPHNLKDVRKDVVVVPRREEEISSEGLLDEVVVFGKAQMLAYS